MVSRAALGDKYFVAVVSLAGVWYDIYDDVYQALPARACIQLTT